MLNAQEQAAYRITYDCDALYNKVRQTYRWNLDIGSRTAVFYNPNHRLHSKSTEPFQNSNDIVTVMNEIRQLAAKYPNRSSLEVLIGKPEAGKYTYINKAGIDLLTYEAPLPAMEWTLTDSVKSVCGYRCHQARAEVYGRSWIVWYATELPLAYGPYILGGLPGLILEASDSEGIFWFVAVGIETAPEQTAVELFAEAEATRCTRSKYLSLRQANEEQTYSETVKNLLGGSGATVTRIVDASGKEISNQKQPKKNYLDRE